jgi:hypothetical protein
MRTAYRAEGHGISLLPGSINSMNRFANTQEQHDRPEADISCTNSN